MWLTEFRAAHGLSIEQLGHAVRMRGEKLDPPIYIRNTTLINLEREPGYLVIPAFANLIAEVCGATAEQRDALTLPKHAGKWKPTGMPAAEIIRARVERAVKERRGNREQGTGNRKSLPLAATNALARAIQQPAERPRDSNRGRAVVAIDTDGKVRATYRGPFHAAKRCGISTDMVIRRCARKMKSNEFEGLGYTFRFRDDWERMTEEERRADTDRTKWWRSNGTAARIRAGKPKHGHFRRAVVVIDAEGHELGRYSMAKDAAAAMGEAYGTIISHVMMSKGFATHYTRRGRGYFYADEWDEMDEDAKAAATLRGQGR